MIVRQAVPKGDVWLENHPKSITRLNCAAALQETAVYPQRFCTALFQAWVAARLAAEGESHLST